MASFIELFTQSCAQQPGSLALRQNMSSLTYAQVEERVGRLAGYLQKLGVVAGETVAVCLPRSFEWIITALAAMRLGAAYVPLELDWPEERLRFVLVDSGAKVLIAAESLAERLGSCPVKIDLCRDREKIAASPESMPTEVSLEDIAYLIYTSGTTGAPKGVEITHANLAHLIAWHCEAFAVTAADQASHLAGLGFDAAGWEIWPYLAAGACVVLVEEGVRSSPELLLRWMIAQRVTIGFVPTSLAAAMIKTHWPNDTRLRLLLTGGDTLLRAPETGLPFSVVNNYGPSECTVVATSGFVQPGLQTRPTIGFPIAGASIYILDEIGQPVQPGDVGEICIGGGGVGRGYRNLPQLTEQSFIRDPFSALPGARLYRTGDRGERLPSGEIKFHGRLDGQEKIRGRRVELDEITHVLSRHESIDFAIVAASGEGAEEKKLVAHVLPKNGSHLTVSELQTFLARWLPAHMIPAFFVQLTSIPLTLNGKIDRSALASPTPENALAAPPAREVLSPLEETLLTMVQGLLGTNDVTVEDDFFLVGGHSLLGTQLVLRIRAAFGVDLTLRDLFEAATVEQLSFKITSLLVAELDDMTDEEALQQVRA